MRRIHQCVALAMAVSGSWNSCAWGVTRTWNGSVDAQYTSATEWSPTGVPAISDVVNILGGRALTSPTYKLNVANGGSILISGAGTGLGKVPANSDSHPGPILSVGSSGSGSITVQNGGQLASNASEVGGTNAVGSVALTGPGSNWNVDVSHFIIGAGPGGEGTLTLNDHAFIDYFNEIEIGGDRAKGTVIANNASLKAAALDVGAGGAGTLSIQNGTIAVAQLTGVGRYSAPAGPFGRSGTLLVDGPTTTLTNIDDPIVGGIPGKLTVGVGSAGTVKVSNGAIIHNTGGTEVGLSNMPATVILQGANACIVNDKTVKIGSGTATSQVMLETDTLISAGQTVTLGSMTELSFTANAAGNAGKITAGTSVTITEGVLNFHLASGYVPAANAVFPIITAPSIIGHFAEFHSDVPASLVYAANGVSVVLPEPTAVVATVVLIAVVSRRRSTGKS